ncbi:MAG: M23 family metallopeptidase [Betaproteobacteria bacterium]|nr:M23 family metallopeptidase [Betaproteobacteria bacterium]
MVRRDKNGKMTIPHHGWDLYAEHGTECYAVDDGEVIRATSITGYGYTIDILLDARISGHPVYARYAHLSRFAAGIKEKERVAMGQLIGFTGNSGNAGGMTGFAQHLHFEFMKYSVPRRGSDGLQHRYDPARIYGVTPLSPAAVRDPLEKLFEPCDTSINAMLNPSVRKPGCPDIRDIQKGNQQQKGAKP